VLTELQAHLNLARPGTLIDVGAHTGAFTLPMAQLPDVGVLAFEPIPEVAKRLQERLGRELGDRAGNVAVFSVALGDLPRRSTLSIPTVDGNPMLERASIVTNFEAVRAHDPVRLGASVNCEVDVWPLDSLDLHDVKAIKLDAEGNEYAVLRGARHTIARCRPFISVELEEHLAPGCTWSVPAFLDALRYDGYFVHEQTIYPVSALRRDLMHRTSGGPARPQCSNPYICEYYFIPREDTTMRRRFMQMAAGGFRMAVDASRLSRQMAGADRRSVV
jgi:FkbM family methyltransferase